MKIRHNRREKLGLSAGLAASVLTRAEACAMYAPGSDGWNRWNCGPVPTAPPPPSYAPPPAPVPAYAPPPPPSTYVRPPPPPPPPSIDYDAEYARRVQEQTNARIAADLLADEASKLALSEAEKARAAQAEADLYRASAEASMQALDAGGGWFSTFDKTQPAPMNESDASSSSMLIVGAIAALAVFASMKRKGAR